MEIFEKLVVYLTLIITLTSLACSRNELIHRRMVVERHTVISNHPDKRSPAQVGNGEFAFGADITGLQTFIPFNTMSHWGWHSDPLPEGTKIENFKGQLIDTYGRMVKYPLVNQDDDEQKALSNWLAGNPHRINLGRIAFLLKNADGSLTSPEELTNCRQHLNMWTGIISSYFELDGKPVRVKTACHPKRDIIGVQVESELMIENRLSVIIEFPFASAENSRSGDYIGTWDRDDLHQTKTEFEDKQVNFIRTQDDNQYYVSLKWFTEGQFEKDNHEGHLFRLIPDEKKLQFVCAFSPNPIIENLCTTNECLTASKKGWADYWFSGAALDLSCSADPRWKELERRIILSQYLMKVNEAGSLPPQESGLVRNDWYGKFHFEMIWWHAAHWALWNRWKQAEKSLEIYHRFLSDAKERAENEGFNGARWPKCTAYENVEWPHPCHAFLIWQQPHPLYFAELDYRIHPNAETLEKWKEVVFNTAGFMASIAHFDTLRGEYVLGPPLIPVSENTGYTSTLNPSFELSYWRFGLKIANEWYKRLGIKTPGLINTVFNNLAPLPVENDLYILHEGLTDMWTNYNYEHPALIGVYGMLPGDGVDLSILEKTFEKIMSGWDFERVWGWDFPMLAMTAARLGKTEEAIDLLLHDDFHFDQHGYAFGGKAPYAYFPSNGGLLAAVAMMAGGWDGNKKEKAPGFPKNKMWKIKSEGFNEMP